MPSRNPSEQHAAAQPGSPTALPTAQPAKNSTSGATCLIVAQRIAEDRSARRLDDDAVALLRADAVVGADRDGLGLLAAAAAMAAVASAGGPAAQRDLSHAALEHTRDRDFLPHHSSSPVWGSLTLGSSSETTAL